jgi:hypothetical protein
MTYDLADWMSVRARPPASSATMRYSSVKVPPATRGRSAMEGADERAGGKTRASIAHRNARAERGDQGRARSSMRGVIRSRASLAIGSNGGNRDPLMR